MAPIMLPRDWLFTHPSYAALDEYLRWSRSRQGAYFNLNPETREVVFQTDPATNANLPTTTYRNLLDHLNHVYTKDGVGPSVLSLVMEMLPDAELKHLRNVSKSIGTLATKTYCKSLRLPVDSFIPRPGGRVLINFVTAFSTAIRRANPAQPRPAWLMNPAYVKELHFYSDPVTEERIIRLYTDFQQQLEANDLFDPSIAMRATWQDGRALLRHPRDVEFQQTWYAMLYFIERCQNLEVFKWLTDVWQPTELLQVLAFNCPKLAKLDLNFAEPVFQGNLSRDNELDQLNHKRANAVEQNAYTLPTSTDVRVRIAVRRDEYILPIIVHMGVFTSQVNTLEIDRSLSDKGYSAYDQGWDKEAPLVVEGRFVRQLAAQKAFSVRSLVMISIGNKSRFVMSLLDTSGLRELTMNRCMHVEFILNPLVRDAKFLSGVAILFGDRHADMVEGPSRYYHLKIQDHRYALDFVRAGNFTLTDLLLHADFADSRRQPRSYTLLVPELWFAIQAHMATLVRLSVLNPQVDFRVTDIEELGRCAPRLQELRIQARMGAPNNEAPSPLTEGLAFSLKRALLAFSTHKTLRVFAIIKSDSKDLSGDTDPLAPHFVKANNLEAVTNAVKHGVPIKLFTYFEDPFNMPANCHFYYNKTPFEPEVNWGVFPYPSPPVDKHAALFKGFEVHEVIQGMKGHSFNEQGNRMLERHEELVKELQLWHPETKRGGATFCPERPKLPSDSIRRVQEPLPPLVYVGDFGDPRGPGGSAVARASGRGIAQGRASRVGQQLAANRSTKAIDWAPAKDPNYEKYYVAASINRSSWHNPNILRPSRKERFYRLSEADRNELFGKELPPYLPVAMSQVEFDTMTGSQLYEWQDLYNCLDPASIAKLAILEEPSTDANRNRQYEVLEEYAPRATAWDINNPRNFTQAKHNLCARQRVFILKEAITKRLVTPTPIREKQFWDKEQNDQLIWLHLNNYVNITRYANLTLAFCLQPMSDIEKAKADITKDIRGEIETFFDEVRNTLIPNALETKKILPDSITETEFMEKVASANLYDWAISRELMAPSELIQGIQDVPGETQFSERLALMLRGEILLKAVDKKLVILRSPTPEREVNAMDDETFYHWAVSRGLLRAITLTGFSQTGIPTNADEPIALATQKRDEVITMGLMRRFIKKDPIIAGARSRTPTPSSSRRSNKTPSPLRSQAAAPARRKSPGRPARNKKAAIVDDLVAGPSGNANPFIQNNDPLDPAILAHYAALNQSPDPPPPQAPNPNTQAPPIPQQIRRITRNSITPKKSSLKKSTSSQYPSTYTPPGAGPNVKKNTVSFLSSNSELPDLRDANWFKEGELRSCSKDELVLRVMNMVTGTELMGELGMRGLVDVLGGWGRDDLVGILMGREDEEDEEEEFDYMEE